MPVPASSMLAGVAEGESEVLVVVRPSTVAVLRSNAQVLELMGAQCEELANRTSDLEESNRLKLLALKCRIVCNDFKDVADDTVPPPYNAASEAA